MKFINIDGSLYNTKDISIIHTVEGYDKDVKSWFIIFCFYDCERNVSVEYHSEEAMNSEFSRIERSLT